MPTNFTLTLDTQLGGQAEAYVHENGLDLASLVETYLETMVRVRNHDLPLSPQIFKLYGSVQLPLILTISRVCRMLWRSATAYEEFLSGYQRRAGRAGEAPAFCGRGSSIVRTGIAGPSHVIRSQLSIQQHSLHRSQSPPVAVCYYGAAHGTSPTGADSRL